MSLEDYTFASKLLINIATFPPATQRELEKRLKKEIGLSLDELPRGKGNERQSLTKVIAAYALFCQLGKNEEEVAKMLGVKEKAMIKNHTLRIAINMINTQRRLRRLPPTSLKREMRKPSSHGELPLNIEEDSEA